MNGWKGRRGQRSKKEGTERTRRGEAPERGCGRGWRESKRGGGTVVGWKQVRACNFIVNNYKTINKYKKN